jgi:hypothetical protein
MCPKKGMTRLRHNQTQLWIQIKRVSFGHVGKPLRSKRIALRERALPYMTVGETELTIPKIKRFG